VWIYPGSVTQRPSPLIAAFGWRLPAWLLDYGPVAFVLATGSATILARHRGPTSWAVVLYLLVAAAALLYRRRVPLLVMGIVLVLALVFDEGRTFMVPALIALFTVAEYCDRDKVFGAAILSAIAFTVGTLVNGPSESLFGAVLSHLVAVGLAVAAGLYVRSRADYVGGLRDRAARLERERELLARQAAGEERVRIARELHDVVAHNVSLMVVQAQALAATGQPNAEEQAALGRLAGLGREALSEMHRMLGVLRLNSDGGAEREPQPGVGELERLVARTAETGLDVQLVVRGEPRPLPPAVDLSAYRIVQEALTNVIRHARASHVDVELSYAPGELEVVVSDDGVGPGSVNGAAAGHGLIGMRERVALFGGSLQTGHRDGDGGYRVVATLPTR